MKKIVQRGLEGVRRRNGGRVEIVPLREVVRFEKMAQIVRLLPSSISLRSQLIHSAAVTASRLDRLFKSNLSTKETSRTTPPLQSLPHRYPKSSSRGSRTTLSPEGRRERGVCTGRRRRRGR